MWFAQEQTRGIYVVAFADEHRFSLDIREVKTRAQQICAQRVDHDAPGVARACQSSGAIDDLPGESPNFELTPTRSKCDDSVGELRSNEQRTASGMHGLICRAFGARYRRNKRAIGQTRVIGTELREAGVKATARGGLPRDILVVRGRYSEDNAENTPLARCER